MNNGLRLQYFGWLIRLVGGEDYTQLLTYFASVPFEFDIPMDENREGDGLEMRYRFGRECGIEQYVIANELDDRPCSVFEVMAALALRIEETIMHVDSYGDRTHIWFREMLNSLGVDGLTDGYFSREAAEAAVYALLEHSYEPDGRGGLFRVQPPCPDMRSKEIWEQAMIFLLDYIRFTNSYEMPII